MDLELHVKDAKHVFVKFSELEAKVLELMRQWNNFEDTSKPLEITIKKTPNGIPTLHATTSESVDTNDLFGRR